MFGRGARASTSLAFVSRQPVPFALRATQFRRVLRPRPALVKLQSEKKVPLVGFPFGLSVSSETHLFRIVGAEFIAEELTARCAPRL
jgi:hypothetical protein